ncbi:MAG TPA: hypothetical protein VKB76_06210, partial [Ktedonobacterales bacterium]|nr:hypothetical protein [Ktedonobacterales bacterium]
MTTQSLTWSSEWPSLHELGRYLLHMSRERGERSRRERDHEHHREHEFSGDRAERDGRRERGGRGRRHVGRGDVYAATLLLLEEQPLHGYQIIQLIEERSGGH